jgi:hypothetical protein
MSTFASPAAPASRPVAQVEVTVTTVRGAREDDARCSVARGDFDTAVREALRERLAPWAIDQVLGRVLARRPPAGEPVQYEGSFSPERHLQIAVRPLDPHDPLAPCRTRRLAGLFLPISAPATTESVRP